MAEGEPAYTIVPGKLSELLKKIRTTGVPETANRDWMNTLGFKSSNDFGMLKVLRYIGFIDSSNAPTPVWREYRGGAYKAVLGHAIKTGYKDLYAVYIDAHNQSNTDLGHVFTSNTKSGKAVVDKMVSTFKALVSKAEFTSDRVPAPSGQSAPASSPSENSSEATVNAHIRTPNTASGLTVNINVQLTLPEGADAQTFEAFFKAMRNHLLTDAE